MIKQRTHKRLRRIQKANYPEYSGFSGIACGHTGYFKFWTGLLLALITAVCFLLTTQTLFAQGPSITITEVAHENFPQMVVPITYDNLSADFNPANLTLLENGSPQEISVLESSTGETQVAFLFALSGRTSYKEPIQNAIRRLLSGGVPGVEPAQIGSIAFFAPDATGALKKMADWSTDNNVAFSEFSGLALEGPSTDQLNVPQLVQGITAQFDASNAGPKIIFVFSDGTGATDEGTIQAIRDVAKNAITIHTTLLDTPINNAVALRNIAAAGNGKQYNLIASRDYTDPPETLDPLWVEALLNGPVSSTNGSEIINYQSGLPQKPEKLTVQVKLDDAGSALTDEKVIDTGVPTPTPTPTTEPPVLTINGPIRGQSYRLPWRNAVSSESEAACARELDVEIAPQTADGATVVAATYKLSGPGYSDEPRISDVTSAQFCLYSAMLPGNYYVEVAATDDLGRTNIESEVLIDIKPSWWTILLTYLPLIMLPVALIALGFALYALRNQKVVRPVTERFNKSITTMRTEVFSRKNSMPASVDPSQVRARLIRTSDQSHLPTAIMLTKENTKIGRDRTFADVAVKDQYISRLHCQITIKDDLFTIQDEGSSSGVYLNDSHARVDMMGEILKNGDIIHLGPVQYRFEVSSPAAEPIPDSQGTEVWTKDRPNIQQVASAPTEPMNPRINYDIEQANQKTITETIADHGNSQHERPPESQGVGYVEDPNHGLPTVIDPNIYDPKSAKTEVYEESPKASSAPTERYNQNRNEEW